MTEISQEWVAQTVMEIIQDGNPGSRTVMENLDLVGLPGDQLYDELFATGKVDPWELRWMLFGLYVGWLLRERRAFQSELA